MNRRQLLQSLAAASGHALFPSVLASFLSACNREDLSAYAPSFFTKDEYQAVTDIIDIIIPATKTKSASQVNTQVFLDQVFGQCLAEPEQTALKKGLRDLIPGFRQASDKLQLITEVDQKAYGGDESAAWFRLIKQYTMIGFFTSQEGETKAGNYVKVPEGYQADIPLDDNTLSYGKTFLHY